MSDIVTLYWKAACPHGHAGRCKYDGCQCDMFTGCTCGYQPCPGGTRGTAEFRRIFWCTSHDHHSLNSDTCDKWTSSQGCNIVPKLVEA